MQVHLITVPHHLGSERARVDTGPARLIAAGLDAALARSGHRVTVTNVHCEAVYSSEYAAIFEINRGLAGHVRAARAGGAFPVVLSGNCATSLGAMACLDEDGGGVLYFDAHGDFNTPETSPSGMINGMPLAVAAGKCYPEIWRVIRSRPVPERNILLAGARDLDGAERAALEVSGVELLTPEIIGEKGLARALDPPLARLAEQVHELYIHLDMDGADPAEAPGVSTPAPGGFTSADIAGIVRQAGKRFVIRCASIAEYDPLLDDGTTLRTALDFVETLIETAADTDAAERGA